MRESTRVHRFTGNALVGVILSPFERVADAPLWVWVVAHVLAIWQYLTTDNFGASLSIGFLAMIADYCIGAYAASLRGEWSPALAKSGLMSKLITIVLLGLIKLIEWLFTNLGLPALPWSIATMAAIAVILMEAQSIAHHRERMNARPIPFLSALFKWIEKLLFSRLPGAQPAQLTELELPPPDEARRPS